LCILIMMFHHPPTNFSFLAITYNIWSVWQTTVLQHSWQAEKVLRFIRQ
jgi:hypothetical protein